MMKKLQEITPKIDVKRKRKNEISGELDKIKINID